MKLFYKEILEDLQNSGYKASAEALDKLFYESHQFKEKMVSFKPESKDKVAFGLVDDLELVDNFDSFLNYIFESGFDINAKNSSGVTLLHFAIHNFKNDWLKSILKYSPSLDITCPQTKLSPIELALSLGNLEAANLIDSYITRENRFYHPMQKLFATTINEKEIITGKVQRIESIFFREFSDKLSVIDLRGVEVSNCKFVNTNNVFMILADKEKFVRNDVGDIIVQYDSNALETHRKLIQKTKDLAYKNDDDGICFGITLEHARRILKGTKKDFTSKIKVKLNEDGYSRNFYKRLRLYQEIIQKGSHKYNLYKYIKVNDLNNIKLQDHLIGGVKCTGISIKCAVNRHIILVTNLGNENYQIFDSNYGEFNVSSKAELNAKLIKFCKRYFPANMQGDVVFYNFDSLILGRKLIPINGETYTKDNKKSFNPMVLSLIIYLRLSDFNANHKELVETFKSIEHDEFVRYTIFQFMTLKCSKWSAFACIRSMTVQYLDYLIDFSKKNAQSIWLLDLFMEAKVTEIFEDCIKNNNFDRLHGYNLKNQIRMLMPGGTGLIRLNCLVNRQGVDVRFKKYLQHCMKKSIYNKELLSNQDTLKNNIQKMSHKILTWSNIHQNINFMISNKKFICNNIVQIIEQINQSNDKSKNRVIELLVYYASKLGFHEDLSKIAQLEMPRLFAANLSMEYFKYIQEHDPKLESEFAKAFVEDKIVEVFELYYRDNMLVNTMYTPCIIDALNKCREDLVRKAELLKFAKSKYLLVEFLKNQFGIKPLSKAEEILLERCLTNDSKKYV
ncbi:MAG: hypothetical protein J0G32_01315 [Alphaproteobacteria bacterium]|nr:hypothetical protein [Alphaproteobacteria bacterium]OJV13194.1 MAG: hypothetical protein BGO27_00115 [Alphaproteobacteria bacterium 33-17]